METAQLSGRDLNAEIRRVVFGREVDKNRCGVCGWPLYPTIDQGCTAESCSERPLPRVRFDEPAPYSESIEAAMQVVEKMHQQKLVVRLMNENGWTCSVVDAKTGYQIAFGFADLLPEAICRAALIAIEGEN
jgi:hypothetical protein